MNPWQTIRVAGRALLRNKMRSFLTILGVIIGVAAVIAMVAIGEGAKSQVQNAFSSMGTNMIVVMPGDHRSGGAHHGFGSQPTLTWNDLKAIRQEISTVRFAAPMMRTGGQVVSDEMNWATQIIGTTPQYFDIRSWKVTLGEIFSESDVEAGARVVILGTTVRDKLFGADDNPIGKIIRIKNSPFEIVGVLESKGQTGMGQNSDDVVIVPVSAYQARIESGMRQFINGQIMISASSHDVLDSTVSSIEKLLRERHRIGEEDDNDFSVFNLTEMAAAFQQSTQTMTALLAGIAIVSLIVGGIGIMNIMLVSVSERTREIGVRMAIGARPRDILAQFLVEALVLSLIGGLLGFGAGTGAAVKLASQFGWPVLIRPDIALLAMSFSAVIGVIFGLYPAYKASRLDPIEALRYE